MPFGVMNAGCVFVISVLRSFFLRKCFFAIISINYIIYNVRRIVFIMYLSCGECRRSDFAGIMFGLWRYKNLLYLLFSCLCMALRAVLRDCDLGGDNFKRKIFGDAPIVGNFESAKVSANVRATLRMKREHLCESGTIPVAVSFAKVSHDLYFATALGSGKAVRMKRVRRPACAVAYIADTFGKKSGLASL